MSTHLSNELENVKRELSEAARAVHELDGGDPVTRFREHGRFDFEDPFTGHLDHRSDCPFCRLNQLKRTYGLMLFSKGKTAPQVMRAIWRVQ